MYNESPTFQGHELACIAILPDKSLKVQSGVTFASASLDVHNSILPEPIHIKFGVFLPLGTRFP